ncbi:hypothetical protein NQZ68_030732 [Dissostichus eleginoides]|nr:hypothetical protein NQZ68_030732 [Dissostichus eleginoides]
MDRYSGCHFLHFGQICSGGGRRGGVGKLIWKLGLYHSRFPPPFCGDKAQAGCLAGAVTGPHGRRYCPGFDPDNGPLCAA